VPDYSEFPTTPTAWQEAQWREAQVEAAQALHEDPPPPPAARRRVDLVALIPGIFFCVLAVVLMTGVGFPFGVLRDGGIARVLLIGAGVLLLLGERRRSRRS
jgi:hypothetical protein